MSAVLRTGGTPYPLVVGVIGAGRVGAVLGAAFEAAGHQVVAAAAVSAASRDRAARLLPNASILPADAVARAHVGIDFELGGIADEITANNLAIGQALFLGGFG